MTIELILYLSLVFIAVVAAVLSIGLFFGQGGRVRERLRVLGAAAEGGIAAPPEEGRINETLHRAAQAVAKLSTPGEAAEISRLRVRFLNAGFDAPAAPIVFFAAKTTLAMLLPIAFLLIERLLPSQLSFAMMFLILILLAGLGYYLPNLVLASLTRSRQRRLFEGFPDAIDLMIVCVEAGLGLDVAISRSAGEMRLRCPELAAEMERVSLELRVGSTRARALDNLAIRIGLEDVATFVAMLQQTEQFGTSLAASFRVHADALRTRRRLQAEEAAAKVPLKLLFPLIFMIFPTLMLVLLGPAVLQVYRSLLPAFSAMK